MNTKKDSRNDDLPEGIYPAPFYLLGSVPAILNILCINSHPWLPFLFIFFIVPILEFAFTAQKRITIPEAMRRRRRKTLSELPAFRAVLLTHAALVLASLLRSILYIHAHPADLTFPRIMCAAAVGITGLVAGHEACHKLGADAALERAVGSLLIASVLDPAYRGDHPHHHRNVGLEQDAVCAPMDMSPYYYAVSVEVHAWRHAVSEWRLLYTRTGKLLNPFARCFTLSAALVVLNALILGWNAVCAHIVIAVATTLGFNLMAMLQEHAGLSRLPSEPVSAAISWDCSNPISNLMLFEGGRHSDHHLAGTAPYAQLDLLEEAPELPYGMFTMGIIAALCPLLFWRLVRNGIREYEARMKRKGADAQPTIDAQVRSG